MGPLWYYGRYTVLLRYENEKNVQIKWVIFANGTKYLSFVFEIDCHGK
jgi:hypothetical protein